jgi:hypothetical protein
MNIANINQFGKLVICVLRSGQSKKKQIKNNYKVQFPTNPMLNDKIEKKIN